ncbi:hypothetical protein Tco_0641850 [Tanacetum coccineum]
MAFLSTTFASCYPPTNNHLRTSSNLRNQATIQDGRVTVQTVQGRQTHRYANSEARSNATSQGINRNKGVNITGQARVVKCYNYQEEAQLVKLVELSLGSRGLGFDSQLGHGWVINTTATWPTQVWQGGYEDARLSGLVQGSRAGWDPSQSLFGSPKPMIGTHELSGTRVEN